MVFLSPRHGDDGGKMNRYSRTVFAFLLLAGCVGEDLSGTREALPTGVRRDSGVEADDPTLTPMLDVQSALDARLVDRPSANAFRNELITDRASALDSVLGDNLMDHRDELDPAAAEAYEQSIDDLTASALGPNWRAAFAAPLSTALTIYATALYEIELDGEEMKRELSPSHPCYDLETRAIQAWDLAVAANTLFVGCLNRGGTCVVEKDALANASAAYQTAARKLSKCRDCVKAGGGAECGNQS
jgi:hypothetical protein